MSDKDEGLREAVKRIYEDIMLNEDTEYDTAESVALAIGEELQDHPAPAKVEHQPFAEYFAALPKKEQEAAQRHLAKLKAIKGEPLAVLANRLHYGVEIDPSNKKWLLRLVPLTKWDGEYLMINGTFSKQIKGSTYAEAEARARAYLSGLPDRDGR